MAYFTQLDKFDARYWPLHKIERLLCLDLRQTLSLALALICPRSTIASTAASAPASGSDVDSSKPRTSSSVGGVAGSAGGRRACQSVSRW